MSDVTVVRHFAMKQDGCKTTVHFGEMSNGNIWVQLKTERDNAEGLATEFILTPGTFNLLASAMFMAAHDGTVWNEAKKGEASE